MKGGIPEATNLIVDLREKHNLFCSVVVYPVIPKGEIILRLIPTAAHTLDDVKFTIGRSKPSATSSKAASTATNRCR